MDDSRFPCDQPPANVGDRAEGTVVVTALERRTTKSGQPYAVVTLANATGKVTVRVWSDRLDEWTDVVPGTPLHVRCTGVSAFPDGLGWSVDDLAVLPSTHPVAEESVPPCPVALSDLYDRTRALLQRCSQPALALLHVLLHTPLEWGDGLLESVAGRWRRWPAAVGHHHAVRHGLWWHSLQVTQAALAMADVLEADGPVPLNRDVLIVGGLLHDVGKIDELRAGGGIGDGGRLATHILWGAVRLQEATTRAKHAGIEISFEQRRLFDDVLHVCASHHGTVEWGANIRPASREAWLLHAADLASAHVEKGADAARAGVPIAEHWLQPVGGWARDAVRVTPPSAHTTDPALAEQVLASLAPVAAPAAPPVGYTDHLLSFVLPFPLSQE